MSSRSTAPLGSDYVRHNQTVKRPEPTEFVPDATTGQHIVPESAYLGLIFFEPQTPVP